MLVLWAGGDFAYTWRLSSACFKILKINSDYFLVT